MTKSHKKLFNAGPIFHYFFDLELSILVIPVIILTGSWRRRQLSKFVCMKLPKAKNMGSSQYKELFKLCCSPLGYGHQL